MNLGNVRFSASAWAKLCYMRDKGDTEIGGFGVSHPNDPLLVQDFVLIKQVCTMATVEFDDESVADFMEDMVDAGYQPKDFMRIWIHTHPGNSAQPSLTDENTFKRVFENCDWSVMAILARGGDTYCRIKFTNPVTAEFESRLSVDWDYEFDGVSHANWDQEYDANVSKKTYFTSNSYLQYHTKNRANLVGEERNNVVANKSESSRETALFWDYLNEDDTSQFNNWEKEYKVGREDGSDLEFDGTPIEITPNEQILLDNSLGNKNLALARIRSKFKTNKKG